MSRNRGDSGRFTDTTTLADVLDVFDAVAGPVVTSGDVAESLDCSRETARRKLRTLEDGGHVESRKIAGRVVWWRTDPTATARQFEEYDDQKISFVDHATSDLADERDVDHVFTFDSDFRTLGFTLVPEDTGKL
ncbi:hypothetical protein [Natronorubrum sp. DTA7]|uniref:hypothetical protein n=1 Tax=Natronorubrum sp. DTA7 TaxID=3447016 RepID=UPI003F835373